MSRNSTNRARILLVAGALLIPAALCAGATMGHAMLLAPASFAVSTPPCSATSNSPSDGNLNSHTGSGATGNENTGNCVDGNELTGDNQTGNGQS